MSDTPRTKEIDKLRDYVNNQESEYKTLGAYAIAFDRLDLMVMESERENQELRAQLEQERDIRSDLGYLVTKIAQNICVPQEPHQTFEERLMETLASIVRSANESRELRAQLAESAAALAVCLDTLAKISLAGSMFQVSPEMTAEQYEQQFDWIVDAAEEAYESIQAIRAKTEGKEKK